MTSEVNTKLVKSMTDAIKAVAAPLSKRLAAVEHAFESHKEHAATVEQLALAVRRINELEGQVRKLEAETEARSYKGVWANGRYQKHNVVTLGGSMWTALIDTEQKPGNGADWQLCVQKGRDANRRGVHGGTADSRSY